MGAIPRTRILGRNGPGPSAKPDGPGIPGIRECGNFSARKCLYNFLYKHFVLFGTVFQIGPPSILLMIDDVRLTSPNRSFSQHYYGHHLTTHWQVYLCRTPQSVPVKLRIRREIRKHTDVAPVSARRPRDAQPPKSSQRTQRGADEGAERGAARDRRRRRHRRDRSHWVGQGLRG